MSIYGCVSYVPDTVFLTFPFGFSFRLVKILLTQKSDVSAYLYRARLLLVQNRPGYNMRFLVVILKCLVLTIILMGRNTDTYIAQVHFDMLTIILTTLFTSCLCSTLEYGMVYGIYGKWYMVYGIWYMVYGIWYIMYGV